MDEVVSQSGDALVMYRPGETLTFLQNILICR